MKRFSLLIAAVAMLSTEAFAATPNVQVKIQHFSATAPLDDQPVRLEAMSVAAPVAVQRGFTDENGQITFNSMPAGRYKLFLFHTPELEINIPDTSGTIQASSYVTTEGWIIATADDAGVIDLQTTQVMLLGNGLTKAGNTLQLSDDVALTGALSLSGQSNRLEIVDDELTLDGEAIGSGGETVWTNSAGIVKPAGGQALTNRLQFVSGAEDDTTNAAVVIGSSTTWTDGRLASFKNNGTNQMAVSSRGEILVGQDVEGNESDLAIYRTAAEGQTKTLYQNSFLTGGGALVQAYDDMNASRGTRVVNWNNSNEVTERVSATTASIWVHVGGSLKVALEPTTAAGVTPFSFDTSLSHTSGNLAEVKNNGTNKLAVAFDGATTIAQVASEPANPAAGYFTLFSIDSGGGKMILKVRFPTGASQTIATEP